MYNYIYITFSVDSLVEFRGSREGIIIQYLAVTNLINLCTLSLCLNVFVWKEKSHDGLVELERHLDPYGDHIHLKVFLHSNTPNWKIIISILN